MYKKHKAQIQWRLIVDGEWWNCKNEKKINILRAIASSEKEEGILSNFIRAQNNAGSRVGSGWLSFFIVMPLANNLEKLKWE